MVHLGQHLNLVNLLGAVTKNITRCKYPFDNGQVESQCLRTKVLTLIFIPGNMMIIVEYCRFGSLQNILMENRSTFIDQIDRQTDTIVSKIKEGKRDTENDR